MTESEIDKNYKTIGRIVVAFNNLDIQLNSFIGSLISDDVGIGQIVTAAINSFQIRWKLLFAIFKKQASSLKWFNPPYEQEDFEERQNLVDEMFELKKRAINGTKENKSINFLRNKIIHSYWFQQQRHIEQYGESAELTGLDIKSEQSQNIDGGKTGLQYDVISMSDEEISAFTDKIDSLTTDLISLKNKIDKLKKQLTV